MKHPSMFVQAIIVCLLFAQPLSIRMRFGKRMPTLLHRYSRCMIVLGFVMLAPLVCEYFMSNVFPPWFADFGPSLTIEDLYVLPLSRRWIWVIVQLLPIAMNSAWLPSVLPPLFLELLKYEGIPVSRMQAFFSKASGWLSVACVSIGFLMNAGFYAQIVAANSFMKRFDAVFLPAGIALSICIYGTLFAWTIHALQTKVFQASPFLRRVSRSAVAVTSICLVFVLFQEIVRLLSLPLPAWLDPIAARGEWTYFPAYWLLAAAWGTAGMYVLFRTAPGAPQSPEQREFRDPEAKPVPAGDALAAVFRSKGLSERESQAAELIVGGAGNKEIAERMGISYNTVKNHVASIFHKLGATNRFELIRQLRDQEAAAPALSK